MLLKNSDLDHVDQRHTHGRQQLRDDVYTLSTRVDLLEEEMAEQMRQSEKWRNWVAVLTFGMWTASLLLAGVYLGGVLF